MALRYLAAKQEKSGVSAAIVSAPMLGISTEPFPRFIARSLVWAASSIGFGESYAVGHGDYDLSRFKFEGNKTTHDRRRFERQKETCEKYSQYVTGGATYGWVEATFQSIKTLLNPKTLRRLKMPIFMANSTNDTMVDNTLDQKSYAQMPGCTLKTYTAKHNILTETDEVRNQFFLDMRVFLKKVLPDFPDWANKKGHPACPKVLTPEQQKEIRRNTGMIYKGHRLGLVFPPTSPEEVIAWASGSLPAVPDSILRERFAYLHSAFVDQGVSNCNYLRNVGTDEAPFWRQILRLTPNI